MTFRSKQMSHPVFPHTFSPLSLVSVILRGARLHSGKCRSLTRFFQLAPQWSDPSLFLVVSALRAEDRGEEKKRTTKHEARGGGQNHQAVQDGFCDKVCGGSLQH